jgi:hypothetical protein
MTHAEKLKQAGVKKPCSIENCENLTHGRGWCKKHHQQWRKTGNPIPNIMRTGDDFARVNYNLDKSGDCWVWKRRPNDKGYGRTWIKGVQTYVHRYMYEQLVGKIPTGLELDHLCRNRACANPSHLEPVTHSINVSRGLIVTKKLSRTSCGNRHELTDDNTYIWKDYKMCRKCRHINKINFRQKRRLEGGLVL